MINKNTLICKNKIITRANIETTLNNKQLEEEALENEKIKNALNGKTVVKVIVIPNRLINIIAK